MPKCSIIAQYRYINVVLALCKFEVKNEITNIFKQDKKLSMPQHLDKKFSEKASSKVGRSFVWIHAPEHLLTQACFFFFQCAVMCLNVCK